MPAHTYINSITYPVQIDRREGQSGCKPLEDDLHTLEVPTSTTTLAAGDYAIVGKHRDGDILVGIERKRVDDLISSIDKGRLTDSQLVEMHDLYSISYLLIEGMYRLGPDNTIEKVVGNSWRPIVNQNMRYTRLVSRLIHIQQTGVKIIHTNSEYESAVAIKSIWSWWSKDWDDHEAQNPYTPLDLDGSARTTQGPVRYRDLPEYQKLLWRFAQQLPGVMTKAAELTVQLRTSQALANINLPDLESILGKGTRSRKIVELLRGKGI